MNTLITKMIDELKEDKNKQLNEFRKTMSDMKYCFSKAIKATKRNKAEILKMKSSAESFDSRQD